MAAQIVKKFHEEREKTQSMSAELAKKYREEIDKAQKDLETLVNSKELSAFDMLRLAYAYQFTIAYYHDSKKSSYPTSTDDDKTKETEQSAKKNHLQTIEKLKEKNQKIKSRDFYQLAGIVALKTLKGPNIDFLYDKTDLPISPDESCFPDITLSLSQLRDVFRKVNISDPKHIVALYGGLKLAKDGARDVNLKFENPEHLFNVIEEKLSLTEKEEFGKYVKRYAEKKELFSEDYKEAHKKLFEFELPPSTNIIPPSTNIKWSQVVVVAAAVVILSVFYVINRRRAKHSSKQFQ